MIFLCEDTMDLQRELLLLGTSTSFSRIIATYVRGRVEIFFADIPGLPGLPGLPGEWRKLAADQDAIGWDNFMEGNVSKGFCNIVRLQMLTRESYLTAEDWTKKFISRLLQISHGQWLYRNAVVHERMGDGLT